MPNIEDTIKQQIKDNAVLLYMKGSPDFPMCGFSAKVAHILSKLNTKFSYLNILENPEIRTNLPKVSDWPTFPQLFINGELIGGCDIVTELYNSGELLQALKEASAIESMSSSSIITKI